MTQEAPQLPMDPPQYGVPTFSNINKAFESVITDFSGSAEPTKNVFPYSRWADTANGVLKRRNAAGTAWVIEGRLLRTHLPMYALADVPALDIGPIYIIGQGPAEWVISQYVALIPAFPSNADLQWLGTPIGGYITPLMPPSKDDPRFRYVLCTAGQTGPGGYNEGILTGETVTGSAPLVVATATVSLAGSPFDGLPVHLINTEGRFIGAGESEVFEDDMMQGHVHGTALAGNKFYSVTTPGSGGLDGASGYGGRFDLTTGSPADDSTNGTPRTGNHTQPRTHRLVHYRRIL